MLRLDVIHYCGHGCFEWQLASENHLNWPQMIKIECVHFTSYLGDGQNGFNPAHWGVHQTLLSSTGNLLLQLAYHVFVFRYIPEGLGCSCGPDWYTHNEEFHCSSYTNFLMVTCFIAPLGIIIFSYSQLLGALRAVSLKPLMSWFKVLVWSCLTCSCVLHPGSSPADGVSLHPEGREGSFQDDHCHGGILHHLLWSICPRSPLLRLLIGRKQRLSTRHHPGILLQELMCLQPTHLCLHEQTGELIASRWTGLTLTLTGDNRQVSRVLKKGKLI